MKKMKRFFAVLMAMAMALGLSVTAFAAKPTPKDTAEVTITELETEDDEGNSTGVEVKLYQIATGEYNGNGFVKYVPVEGLMVTDPKDQTKRQLLISDLVGEVNEDGTKKSETGPSSEIINELANYFATQNSSYTVTDYKVEDGKFTGRVAAGAYIAVITSGGDKVYNPVLLTATYTTGSGSDSSLAGGEVSVENAYLWGDTAVAKSKTPTIEKEIKTATNDTTHVDEEGNDIKTGSLGDVVSYQLNPTLPSYPVNASNKTFFIADEMATGLTLKYNTLAIYLGKNDKGEPLNAPEISTKYRTLTEKEAEKGYTGSVRQYFYKDADGKDVVFAESVKTTTSGKDGFNINFDYEKLVKDDIGNTYPVTITYDAIINENAVVGSDGNRNDVTMIYSKKPNTGSDWDTPFEKPPITGDQYGYDEDDKIVYTYQLAFLKHDDNKQPLPNAVFGIYTNGNTETKEVSGLVAVVKTNDKGFAVSTQVGAGTYYIKEIQAPEGYTLNENVFPITAAWKTATKTHTSTEHTIHYTAEKPSEDAAQVGWLVGAEDSDKGIFHKINEYEERDDGKIVEVSTGDVVENVYAAYLVSSETKIDKNTTVIDSSEGNKDAGAVLLGSPIENTKLSSLPSTGGMGTMIFTVVGCLIMIVAAGFYFSGRKKSAAK